MKQNVRVTGNMPSAHQFFSRRVNVGNMLSVKRFLHLRWVDRTSFHGGISPFSGVSTIHNHHIFVLLI